ncbi:hypothetical protein [Roseomonas sp. KE2513]|uniref:hypothetical protein n=1 Tax=Roseomonas sp. KE2513 TaxID=2479202 RepID=UPI0018DF0FF3|nr:hypothetical protein [Roseomonas sp. KE2513]
MTQAGVVPPGWTATADYVWTRILPIKEGEPPLLLRVFPNPLEGAWDEPWRWEIVEAGYGDGLLEPEIDTGGATGLEAAMEAASTEAAAHVAGLADEQGRRAGMLDNELKDNRERWRNSGGS